MTPGAGRRGWWRWPPCWRELRPERGPWGGRRRGRQTCMASDASISGVLHGGWVGGWVSQALTAATAWPCPAWSGGPHSVTRHHPRLHPPPRLTSRAFVAKAWHDIRKRAAVKEEVKEHSVCIGEGQLDIVELPEPCAASP